MKQYLESFQPFVYVSATVLNVQPVNEVEYFNTLAGNKVMAFCRGMEEVRKCHMLCVCVLTQIHECLLKHTFPGCV